MKATIKNVSDFFTATKGECNWSVISFDPVTMKRTVAYGGQNMMNALVEMAREGAHGNVCILTNKAGWDFVMKFECANHRRVTFEDMKPYRVYINEFDGFKMESAAFIK